MKFRQKKANKTLLGGGFNFFGEFLRLGFFRANAES